MRSLLFRQTDHRDLTWSDVYGDAPSAPAGVRGALRLAPVYSAVTLIADLWSTAPMYLVKIGADATVPAKLPTWLRQPDPFISRFDWRCQLVASLKLRGNAYGRYDGTYLRWLHPDWVQVDESNPLLPRYYVNGRPTQLVERGGDLVHVREFSQPGSVKALSPIANFADDLDTAALARSFGRRWFSKSAIPPAILSVKTERYPANKLVEARDDFVRAAQDGKPVALPGEWNWQKVSISPEEAQFLQTIKASATVIASIFRVPPEDIGGETGSSRTYGNREADAERLNVRTLMPISARLTEALRPILGEDEEVRVDLDALAQPGEKEKAEAERAQLENGSLMLEELRARYGRRQMTAAEEKAWIDRYRIKRAASESQATSVSVTKEAV